MDTDQPTTVTITLKLSTEEAQDLAVLLPRLVADRLTRFSWRSCGDTDITVARWQAFTGEVAYLDSDGRTFEEVGAERHSSDPNAVGARP